MNTLYFLFGLGLGIAVASIECMSALKEERRSSNRWFKRSTEYQKLWLEELSKKDE